MFCRMASPALSTSPDFCKHDTRVNICQDCRSFLYVESHDQAWQDGYDLAHQEAEDYVAGKEAFIEQQSELITCILTEAIDRGYRFSPAVEDGLRDYL